MSSTATAYPSIDVRAHSPQDVQIRVGRFVIDRDGLSHEGLLPACIDVESLSDGDVIRWLQGRSYVRPDELPQLVTAFFLALMYHGVTPRSAPWAAKQGADDITVLKQWMKHRKEGRGQ